MGSVQDDHRARSRDTGMALVLLLLLVFASTGHFWLVAAAIAAHVMTMTAPRVFAPLAVVWFGVAHFLGEVTSRVLLTLIFFVVVTPVAAARRALGRDSLALRAFKRGTHSALVTRDHRCSPGDCDRPF